jgi:hypothetical protein
MTALARLDERVVRAHPSRAAHRVRGRRDASGPAYQRNGAGAPSCHGQALEATRTQDQAFYREYLSDDATPVVPAGTFTKDQIVAAMGDGTFQSSAIDDERVVVLSPDAGMVTYVATFGEGELRVRPSLPRSTDDRPVRGRAFSISRHHSLRVDPAVRIAGYSGTRGVKAAPMAHSLRCECPVDSLARGSEPVITIRHPAPEPSGHILGSPGRQPSTRRWKT